MNYKYFTGKYIVFGENRTGKDNKQYIKLTQFINLKNQSK